MATLSTRDRELLAFEARWPIRGGAKESRIRTELGMTPTRYFQTLNDLIETPAALEAEPHLVKSLLDARARRRVARDHREFALRRSPAAID